MSGKKKSLAVFLSLALRLKGHKKHDKVIGEMTECLVKHGVCTLAEVREQNERFENLVKEVEQRTKSGMSYKRAYRLVISKYPEFDININ